MKKVGIVSAIAIVLIVVIGLIKSVGWNNAEVDLTSQFTAQEKVMESFHDKMWKILKQQAGVVDKYQGDFNKIYVGIMEGRYGQGSGKLMNWIQERNPEFDSSLYKQLMVSIEAQRTGFHREQTKLIDIEREHTNLMKKFPSSLVVGNAIPLKVSVISSTKSKAVFEAGVDNDVSLFDKQE